MGMGLLPAKLKRSDLLHWHCISTPYMLQKATFTCSESAFIWRQGGKMTRAFCPSPKQQPQPYPWQELKQLFGNVSGNRGIYSWASQDTWNGKSHTSVSDLLMKYLSLQCLYNCIFSASNICQTLSVSVLSLSYSLLCFSLCLWPLLCLPSFSLYLKTLDAFQLGKIEELWDFGLLDNSYPPRG